MSTVEMVMSRDWQRCSLILSTLPEYSDSRFEREDTFMVYLVMLEDKY